MVREREKGLMEDPIVWTSPGWTERMTEVAVLPSLERASGLRNLAASMRTSLELRIDSASHGKSSFGSSGRKAMGSEWMASWVSLGARRKGSQGESPTGKDWLSWEERVSK